MGAEDERQRGEGPGEHVGPETSSEETLVPSQTCHLKKTQHMTYTKQIRSPVSVSGFLASLELLTKKNDLRIPLNNKAAHRNYCWNSELKVRKALSHT